MKPQDKRLSCPCCHVRTWRTDYLAFLGDHDRPDGRICQAGKRRAVEVSDREGSLRSEVRP